MQNYSSVIVIVVMNNVIIVINNVIIFIIIVKKIVQITSNWLNATVMSSIGQIVDSGCYM